MRVVMVTLPIGSLLMTASSAFGPALHSTLLNPRHVKLPQSTTTNHGMVLVLLPSSSWSSSTRLFADSNNVDDLPPIDLEEIPTAADFIEPLLPISKSEPVRTTAMPSSTRGTRNTNTYNNNNSNGSGSGSGNQPFNQQPDYGKGKDLPNTYVRCGTCSSHFAIRPEDLGERGKGRRLECCVCGNTWFQSKDRVMTLRPGMELVELPQMELERVALNKQEGKPANFVGDAKLYVGNLAFECTEQVIYEEFSKVGTVGEISMVYDNESGRPRGFAFVTMRTQDDANKVIQAMNGFEIMGRELSIREANN